MLKPIKFKIIELDEAYEAFLDDPLPKGWSDEYLKTRPRILTDIDLFCENIRSKKQKIKNFNLFERTNEDDEGVVYVFSIYLELFEYAGKLGHILRSIEYFSKKYKDNLVLFQWNHDQDYAKYGSLIEKFNNVKVINFGYTSKQFSNSIAVPFWNINTKQIKEDKRVWASFYGTGNNALRKRLINNISNWVGNDFVHSSGIVPSRYYTKISQSTFSLCPRGGPCDGGFSYRFFECMHLNTVPVLFVDTLVFPYEDELDWDKLCLRFPESMVDDLPKLKYELEKAEPRTKEMMKYIEENRQYFSLYGVQKKVYEEINKYYG